MKPEGDRQTLLEFPCEFPIKAMGEAGLDFEVLVVTIVRRHVPDLGEAAVKTRESGGGKYVSVTVTINATCQEQIDAVYMDLTAQEQVLVVL